METCEGCRFYRPSHKGSPNGECRKNAPLADSAMRATWRMVQPDMGDGCGERIPAAGYDTVTGLKPPGPPKPSAGALEIALNALQRDVMAAGLVWHPPDSRFATYAAWSNRDSHGALCSLSVVPTENAPYYRLSCVRETDQPFEPPTPADAWAWMWPPTDRGAVALEPMDIGPAAQAAMAAHHPPVSPIPWKYSAVDKLRAAVTEQQLQHPISEAVMPDVDWLDLLTEHATSQSVRDAAAELRCALGDGNQSALAVHIRLGGVLDHTHVVRDLGHGAIGVVWRRANGMFSARVDETGGETTWLATALTPSSAIECLAMLVDEEPEGTQGGLASELDDWRREWRENEAEAAKAELLKRATERSWTLAPSMGEWHQIAILAGGDVRWGVQWENLEGHGWRIELRRGDGKGPGGSFRGSTVVRGDWRPTRLGALTALIHTSERTTAVCGADDGDKVLLALHAGVDELKAWEAAARRGLL